jgi:hypothetical protein
MYCHSTHKETHNPRFYLHCDSCWAAHIIDICRYCTCHPSLPSLAPTLMYELMGTCSIKFGSGTCRELNTTYAPACDHYSRLASRAVMNYELRLVY